VLLGSPGLSLGIYVSHDQYQNALGEIEDVQLMFATIYIRKSCADEKWLKPKSRMLPLQRPPPDSLADIHTASRQLRHRDLGTIAAYYSDHSATSNASGLWFPSRHDLQSQLT
jgi:hypothetical protein